MTDPYDSAYDPAVGAGALLIASLIWLVIGGGIYVWYAWALSKVFAKLGAPAWKAWVPVVNEAEVFSRGGVPAWQVVFYFLPVVNLYALYLRWTAAGRIGAFFGKGSGFTVLAILASPVWATLLATAKAPASIALSDRISPANQVRSGAAAPATPGPVPSAPGPAGVAPATAGVAAPPAPPTAAPPSPPAAAPTGAPYAVKAVPGTDATPTPVAPVAPALTGFSPDAPVNPPKVPTPAPAPTDAPAVKPTPAAPVISEVPSTPTPQIPQPPIASAPAAAPVAPHAPAVPPAPAVAATPAPGASPAPDTATPVVPVVVHNPWAPRDEAAASANPASPTPPEAEAPVALPVAPPSLPPLPPGPATPLAPPPTPAAAKAPVEIPPHVLDDDEDEDGETVVVDRRPRVSWFLTVDGGGRLPLKAPHVLLGRRPTSAEKDVQALPIPDSTRTLSKIHARLDLVDGAWTITDLDSTNGVLLVAPDGGETLVEPGVATEIAGRFLLGKVAMTIEFEGPRA